MNNKLGNFQVTACESSDSEEEHPEHVGHVEGDKMPTNINDKHQALEFIIKKSFNRSIDNQRQIQSEDQFNNLHYLFMSEGNNMTMMTKLFKNVAIRWDTEYRKSKNCIGYIDDAKILEEEERDVISGILILINGRILSIEVP